MNLATLANGMAPTSGPQRLFPSSTTTSRSGTGNRDSHRKQNNANQEGGICVLSGQPYFISLISTTWAVAYRAWKFYGKMKPSHHLLISHFLSAKSWTSWLYFSNPIISSKLYMFPKSYYHQFLSPSRILELCWMASLSIQTHILLIISFSRTADSLCYLAASQAK